MLYAGSAWMYGATTRTTAKTPSLRQLVIFSLLCNSGAAPAFRDRIWDPSRIAKPVRGVNPCIKFHMGQHPDTLILGGGVIGLSCAYYLAREGVRVTVVDKGDLGQQASWAGAGILPPGNPERARDDVARLRAQDRKSTRLNSSHIP